MSSVPEQVIGALRDRAETLGTAESLTGGLVCAALTTVSGSSAVVRGGVVAYATDVKRDLLGVDADLLERGGAVQSEVAQQLAAGACRVLGCDWGLATTGVAGPTEQDGQPVGAVFVAIRGPGVTQVRRLDLSGGREAIRRASVEAVLRLLLEAL